MRSFTKKNLPYNENIYHLLTNQNDNFKLLRRYLLEGNKDSPDDDHTNRVTQFQNAIKHLIIIFSTDSDKIDQSIKDYYSIDFPADIELTNANFAGVYFKAVEVPDTAPVPAYPVPWNDVAVDTWYSIYEADKDKTKRISSLIDTLLTDMSLNPVRIQRELNRKIDIGADYERISEYLALSQLLRFSKIRMNYEKIFEFNFESSSKLKIRHYLFKGERFVIGNPANIKSSPPARNPPIPAAQNTWRNMEWESERKRIENHYLSEAVKKQKALKDSQSNVLNDFQRDIQEGIDHVRFEHVKLLTSGEAIPNWEKQNDTNNRADSLHEYVLIDINSANTLLSEYMTEKVGERKDQPNDASTNPQVLAHYYQDPDPNAKTKRSLLSFIVKHFGDNASDGYRRAKLPLIDTQGLYCAFCESPLTDARNGDIEHKLPKSVFPTEALMWENLVHACKECNSGNKMERVACEGYLESPQKVTTLEAEYVAGNYNVTEPSGKYVSDGIDHFENQYRIPATGVSLDNALFQNFFLFLEQATIIKNFDNVGEPDYLPLDAEVTRLNDAYDAVLAIGEVSAGPPSGNVDARKLQLVKKDKQELVELIRASKNRFGENQNRNAKRKVRYNSIKSVKNQVETVRESWISLLKLAGGNIDYVSYKNNATTAVCWPDRTDVTNSFANSKIEIEPAALDNLGDFIRNQPQMTIDRLSGASPRYVNKVGADVVFCRLENDNKRLEEIAGLNKTVYRKKDGTVSAYWTDQRIVRRTKAWFHAMKQLEILKNFQSEFLDLKTYYEVQLDRTKIGARANVRGDDTTVITALKAVGVNNDQISQEVSDKWDNKFETLKGKLNLADDYIKSSIWENVKSMVKDGGFYSTWVRTFESKCKPPRPGVQAEISERYDVKLVSSLEMDSQTNPYDPFQFHGTDAEKIIETLNT